MKDRDNTDEREHIKDSKRLDKLEKLARDKKVEYIEENYGKIELGDMSFDDGASGDELAKFPKSSGHDLRSAIDAMQ